MKNRQSCVGIRTCKALIDLYICISYSFSLFSSSVFRRAIKLFDIRHAPGSYWVGISGNIKRYAAPLHRSPYNKACVEKNALFRIPYIMKL